MNVISAKFEAYHGGALGGHVSSSTHMAAAGSSSQPIELGDSPDPPAPPSKRARRESTKASSERSLTMSEMARRIPEGDDRDRAKFMLQRITAAGARHAQQEFAPGTRGRRNLQCVNRSTRKIWGEFWDESQASSGKWAEELKARAAARRSASRGLYHAPRGAPLWRPTRKVPQR